MAKRDLNTTEAVAVLTRAMRLNLLDLKDDPLYKDLLEQERRCKIAKQIFIASQVTILPLTVYEFKFRQKLSIGIAVSRACFIGVFSLVMYAMCPPMRRYYVVMGDLARSRRKELRSIVDKYSEDDFS